MKSKTKEILNYTKYPAILIVIIWAVKIFEYYFDINLGFLGVYPLKLKGLIGVITSPLIHGSFKHLYSNTAPLFVLTVLLSYFYKKISLKIFIYIYLLSGLWVWFGARPAYHIGASGLIYGLASFLIFSGIIRKNYKLLSVSFIVILLYGSLIWGIFPEFNLKKNISWESHLWGSVAGFLLALNYRNQGPERKKYSWDFEDDDDDEADDENAYWNLPNKNKHYENKSSDNKKNNNQVSENESTRNILSKNKSINNPSENKPIVNKPKTKIVYFYKNNKEEEK